MSWWQKGFLVNNIILAGCVIALCGAMAGRAVANGDINVQVENNLSVPLYYRQSECMQAHCPRSFPNDIKQGSISPHVIAKSIRGNGGSMRLDYDSAMGACRFVVQTTRQRDGRCAVPVMRAFPVNSSSVRCTFIQRGQDADCNLNVEFLMSLGH